MIMQTREIDVTGLTNEIYEQRVAVIKLFERISDMHISEIETADQVRDISAKLEKIIAKIDKLTEGATSEEVKYREYWWQFWLPEKPSE